jgi:polyhydroxyalkanoate synthesis regulator phasin
VNRQAATMVLNKQKDYILEMVNTGILTPPDAEKFFETILHDLNQIKKYKRVEFRSCILRQSVVDRLTDSFTGRT